MNGIAERRVLVLADEIARELDRMGDDELRQKILDRLARKRAWHGDDDLIGVRVDGSR